MNPSPTYSSLGLQARLNQHSSSFTTPLTDTRAGLSFAADNDIDKRATLGLSARQSQRRWGFGVADGDTTLTDLKALVRQFVEERAWQPFHSPKNLAMGIAVEAAELMECFLWLDLPASHEAAKQSPLREAIADEMADVFCYLLNLSNVIGIDLSEALRAKMVKNAIKYPAEKYHGKFRI